MAGYSFLLALMRLLLFRYTRGHGPGEEPVTEWKKYRLCGIFLLPMTLTLAIFLLYFLWQIREFRHHEITTIAMAAYTFSMLSLAIVNAFRYRNSESPVYSAAKSISLASALVSLLTLENAMLTAFGQPEDTMFRRIMLGISGLGILILLWWIAVHMIRKAGRKLREFKKA